MKNDCLTLNEVHEEDLKAQKNALNITIQNNVDVHYLAINDKCIQWSGIEMYESKIHR